VSAAGWEAVEAAVQSTLADYDAVIAEVNNRIRETVPEYAYVSEEELTAATRRNIALLLAAIQERRRLSEDELKHFETTVEDRARNGVPIDKYLLAVNTAEAAVWDHMWERCTGPATAEVRLEAFALRFSNTNAVARCTVAAHRRIELIVAREEHERRALALRALLRGGLSTPDLHEHLSRLGLNPDRPYVVVRARARGPVDTDQVQQLLSGRRNHPPYAAFVLWGEDVVGLLADRPEVTQGLTAGVSGPAPASLLSRAHDEASLAFSTAWALDLTGSHDLRGLGLKAAVRAASPSIADNLREKYVAPLGASGSLGEELLATVRAYLESGSRRDAAAARLHVHINTVGYRISRFVELTGADLADLTTLAELWWLFTEMDVRERS
jgi:hypothetical protein